MKFKKINESVKVENKLRGVIDPTYARAIKSRAANKKRADDSIRVARKNTDEANKRLLKREGLSKRVGKKKSLKENYYTDSLNALEDLKDRAFSEIDYQEVYVNNLDDVVSNAVTKAIDDGLIYTEDIIALASYYGVIDTSSLINDIYEDVVNDIYSEVFDYAKDHIIEEDDNLDEAKKSKTRKRKLTEGEGDFYGVDGVKYSYRGGSDLLVEYEGKFYNYYDLEDWLWMDFQLAIEEGDIDIGDRDEEWSFEDWVEEHPERVYSALYALSPYEDLDEGCSKKSSKRRVARKTIKKESKTSPKRARTLVEKPIIDLRPAYDSRKSFYGKAIVDTGDKSDKNKLYSYGTLVAEIKEDGKPIVYGTYSPTTLRHIKEWLKQNGFKAETSKQIMADYGVR